MLYLGNFQQIQNLPDSIFPISICEKIPFDMDMRSYRPLMPVNGFFFPAKETITSYWNDVLSTLSPYIVIQDLCDIAYSEEKKDVLLVCSDSFPKSCLMEWFGKAGIKVWEWGYERRDPEYLSAQETQDLLMEY